MAAMPINRIMIHPGVLLREQIAGLGLSVHRVARDTGLPATRLHEIAHERRGMCADMAIALGEYFGQTPAFWMNSQKAFDLSGTLAEKGQAIRARVRYRAGASRGRGKWRSRPGSRP